MQTQVTLTDGAAPRRTLARLEVPGTRREAHPTLIAVEAAAVDVRRGERRILSGVDLRVESGQLVVLAGPSGAGKTTLLEVLAGLRDPSSGTVVHGAGAPIAGHGRIGFVPQDDLVHKDLALLASLRHAAGLLVDEARTVRHERVERVLEELDLQDSRSVPVGQLSGGQRKRASVAVELLAQPEVLFLDEPTAGLDPATAGEVRGALRRLAGRGVTVILTSHHLSDLESADRLVLLAAGGRVAYDGPPALAAPGFGVTTLGDVYPELARGTVAASFPTPTPTPGNRASAPPAEDGRRPPVPGALAQWRVLVHRNLEVLVRGRLTLAVLIASPALVIAMMATLFPAGLLTAGPSQPLGRQLTFWMAFAAFFFGLTFGLLQVVDDVPILRREHRAGLRLTTYVAAKVTVLIPMLTVVVGLLVGMLQLLGRLPDDLDGDLLVTLLLEAIGALALGLLASSLVRTAAQAALALPMLCFPQVLFAGAVVPAADMPPLGRAISYGLVNRWGFDGARDALSDAPTGRPVADWLTLLGLTLACLVMTVRVLRARTHR